MNQIFWVLRGSLAGACRALWVLENSLRPIPVKDRTRSRTEACTLQPIVEKLQGELDPETISTGSSQCGRHNGPCQPPGGPAGDNKGTEPPEKTKESARLSDTVGEESPPKYILCLTAMDFRWPLF